MGNLRMELHAVELLLVIDDGGYRAAVGHGGYPESVRSPGDTVAVAHPDVKSPLAVLGDVVAEAAEKLRLPGYRERGIAVLAAL